MENDIASRIWRVKEYDAEKAAILSEELGICTNTAALLCVRGISEPGAAKRFINKETCSFYDPFLLKDMDRAAEKLIDAVKSGKSICIYGDYDVDGITATSLLTLYLREKGVACTHYIPKRESEGYGVNGAAIEAIAKDGVDLVVTVDTGVTAVAEIELGKSLGLDFIVTDHHECKDVLPDAVVVNPCRNDCDYPYKTLAGVGVVFKLICACESELAGVRGEMPVEILKDLLTKYAQLVALGTVADVMPVTDENRLIISVGLSMMQNAPDPWCRSILDMNGFYGKAVSKKPISTSTISYTIAPRINAAGRIGDAETAVNLFLTGSKAESDAYAAELCELNRKRQIMENEMLAEAEEMLARGGKDDKFIILESDDWNQGIIGIVASRITEKYGKPCILITFSDEDNIFGKGSGRSVPGINIYEALEDAADLLVKYGGHELAAGLTVEREKLPEFKRRINAFTERKLAESKPVPVLEIDREPKPYEISPTCARELRLLEPFGFGNPSPLFLISDAVIADIMPLGSDKHCRFTLSKDGFTFPAVYFGVPRAKLGFCSRDAVDAVFSMDINNFNNKEELQLIVKSVRAGRSLSGYIEAEKKLYDALRARENVGAEALDGVIPTKDDFKNVYLHVIRLLGQGAESVDCALEARRVSELCGTKISICKFRVILDIFREKEIFEFADGGAALAVKRSEKLAPGEKVSLDGSEILCALREMRKQV